MINLFRAMLRRSLSNKQYLDLLGLSSFAKTACSIPLDDWAVVTASYLASNHVYALFPTDGTVTDMELLKRRFYAMNKRVGIL